VNRFTFAVTWGACVVGLSSSSTAATWSGAATTPTLRQVFAVDATGEPSWPYGQEDVLGDGLPNFTPAEQTIDIRTAYASTDPMRLWLRAYVSDATAPASTVTVYFFIDADRNAATGGGVIATEIDPALASGGGFTGYEYVVGARGTGVIAGVWHFQAGSYMAVSGPPSDALGEAGSDTDPILLNGAAHGYAQAAIALSVIGVGATCDANLYVRSVNNGAGDLDVGQPASCVSVDANNDGLPDVVVPPGGCTTSAQCPGGGQCVNGGCIVTTTCTTDADCPPTDQCVMGRCIARPGGTCSTNSQCVDLVCVNGQCGPCMPGGDQCGTGRTCAGNGRCITPVTLAPGEKVEGGAFHCTIARAPGSSPAPPAPWALGIFGLAVYRRRRRLKFDR
jgi:MYXO-CTERM domain-containing protein